MKDSIFRSAHDHDIDSISELFKVLDTDHYKFSDPTEIRASMEKGRVIVAELHGQIIASVAVRLAEESAEIYSLAVHQDHRGRDLGSSLITEIEKYAAELSIPKIWGWSLVRYNASEFYRRTGFNEMLLLKRQFFGEDCWIFGKLVVKV